ncbi:hypothetical protein YPPY34_0035 [Yersinia pestis PY-34]|nr:hypothetical protein YPPY03_2048 [Yersinia pestis PY-03]EIR78131.1 hypothetical protein YPPY34_1999 [Yersinia pestis PY-34]EIR83791.1 hypothetical protein YPPY34_0035 [Yersinia pestis PY-34]UFA61322.1 Uncharacterized protein YP598_1701 [Yersinia pseudotuberculosis]
MYWNIELKSRAYLNISQCYVSKGYLASKGYFSEYSFASKRYFLENTSGDFLQLSYSQ